MSDKAEMSGEDKRQKILNVSVDLFFSKLFHEVTMEEIARRAGVGKGTLYLYFASKEDLLRAVISYAHDFYYASMVGQLHEGDSAGKKLHKIVVQQLDFVREHLRIIYYLLFEQRLASSHFFQEATIKTRRKLISLVRGIIDDGIAAGEFRPVDALLAAKLFLGSLAALWSEALIGERDELTAGYSADQISALFLDGIRADIKRSGAE